MGFAIPDLTAQRATLKPKQMAFTELTTGRSVNYSRFETQVRHCAGLLSALGIEESDRVAVLCRNRIEFFELLFACAKLGAVFVPLNWRMPAHELQGLVDDCSPRLLVYGAEDANSVTLLNKRTWEELSLDTPGGYLGQRDRADPCRGRRFWPAEETWYLLYTSGTTGVPKGVMQTYGMALSNHVNISQAMSLAADDVTLNYLPLFHTAGINLVTLPTFINGGHVLILPGFDCERVVNLLKSGEIDTFFAVPAVYQEIALHPDFESIDFAAVKSWGSGGAPLSDALTRLYYRRGAPICSGMGMTETGPTVFLMDNSHVEQKMGSIGKPQLLAGVRIVDQQGIDLPVGENGELWFSGPGITPGYWNRPDVTANAFSGSWLKSGDLGHRDRDGYYHLVGRIKDMFISGGENVYPAEVENVLTAHPDILEAAVIAKADEKWGEVGRGFLLPKPGHTLPSDQVLSNYCRERLAAYKVPKSFVVVDDFPRTAAGKIKKHRLEEEK